jgi:hypothetical protein
VIKGIASLEKIPMTSCDYNQQKQAQKLSETIIQQNMSIGKKQYRKEQL